MLRLIEYLDCDFVSLATGVGGVLQQVVDRLAEVGFVENDDYVILRQRQGETEGSS